MARPSIRARRRWPEALTRRRVIITFLALLAFGSMALIGAWMRACAGSACPAIDGLTGYDPDQASKVYAADGRPLTDFGSQRRTVIGLKAMSPAIPAAFLAAEDKRFYQHHGVDWVRMFGAIKNVMLLRRLTGFSTITMQLAGNLFPEEINRQLTGLRGVPRKIREMRVAMEIERRYPKDKILELYLNQINLGSGANGVEAASQRYFGKHASEVNVAEAAMLAALPKAPTRYNPRLHPDLAVQRRNLVLERMQQDGKLTEEEAETWKGYPLALSSHADYSGVGGYFVEYVRQELEAKFGRDLYKEGLRIYTTLDIDAQLAAERACESQAESVENGDLGRFPHPTYQEYLDQRKDDDPPPVNSPYLQCAALVMEAKTGNILAMVGGRDFDDSKFNRIAQATRQPGSTFKPILYSAALESGLSFDQPEQDAPISVPMPAGQPSWEPQNYEGRFTDSMFTLRVGLWRSLNSIAVRVGLAVGEGAVIQEARKFGITTPIDSVPSIFLGSAGVRPIEIIPAYSAFVNLGTRVRPNAILRVEDKDGHMLMKPDVRTYRVLDSVTAWEMNDALRGVVSYGTARGAVIGNGFTIPAGGKTGTTNDYHDVWFIGFTNDLVGGVWMGFDLPQGIMRNAQGGRLAAPAWTRMMQEIYTRRPTPSGWVEPQPEMVQVEIDRTTGFRATPFCPPDVREVRSYPRGQEPKEFCPVHSPFRPVPGRGRGGGGRPPS